MTVSGSHSEGNIDTNTDGEDYQPGEDDDNSVVPDTPPRLT